jgi:hypothetical protein
LVKVSSQSITGVPAAPGRVGWGPNHARNVCSAKDGSGRRSSMPPSRLAIDARPSLRIVAFASLGIRDAIRAHRGSQPSA